MSGMNETFDELAERLTEPGERLTFGAWSLEGLQRAWMARTGSPLSARAKARAATAFPDLPGRARQVLASRGYLRREQVAHTSDAVLLRESGVGPQMLATIRAVLPYSETADSSTLADEALRIALAMTEVYQPLWPDEPEPVRRARAEAVWRRENDLQWTRLTSSG